MASQDLVVLCAVLKRGGSGRAAEVDTTARGNRVATGTRTTLCSHFAVHGVCYLRGLGCEALLVNVNAVTHNLAGTCVVHFQCSVPISVQLLTSYKAL